MLKKFLLMASLSLAACAAQAQSVSEMAAGEDGSAKSDAVETNVALRDADADFKPPSGYKKKTVKGKTRYCKKENVTGTRFPKTYCFTQEQLERQTLNNDEVRRDVARFQQQQGSKDPTGP